MREYVGQCAACGRTIYCEDGFLNGFTDYEGKLSCYDGEHIAENSVENDDDKGAASLAEEIE